MSGAAAAEVDALDDGRILSRTLFGSQGKAAGDQQTGEIDYSANAVEHNGNFNVFSVCLREDLYAPLPGESVSFCVQCTQGEYVGVGCVRMGKGLETALRELGKSEDVWLRRNNGFVSAAGNEVTGLGSSAGFAWGSPLRVTLSYRNGDGSDRGTIAVAAEHEKFDDDPDSTQGAPVVISRDVPLGCVPMISVGIKARAVISEARKDLGGLLTKSAAKR